MPLKVNVAVVLVVVAVGLSPSSSPDPLVSATVNVWLATAEMFPASSMARTLNVCGPGVIAASCAFV